jgi:hypothetical protein
MLAKIARKKSDRLTIDLFIKIYTGSGKLSDFSPEREATRGLQSPCSFLVYLMMWIFYVFLDNFATNTACCTNEIAASP